MAPMVWVVTIKQSDSSIDRIGLKNFSQIYFSLERQDFLKANDVLDVMQAWFNTFSQRLNKSRGATSREKAASLPISYCRQAGALFSTF